MKAYLGIDPGKSGAVCIIYPDKIKAYKCPTEASEMSDIIRHFINVCSIEDYETIIAIEKVWAQPTNGTRHAFAFGTNYGMWLGVLGSHRINPILLLPTKWQSIYKEEYDIPKEYINKKKKLKEIAQGYVDFNVTLATADAILIARYLKEKYNGKKGIQNDIQC